MQSRVVGLGGVKHQVHRLVLEAFVGHAPDGKSYCLHWDDDHGNNRLSNLRWGSQKENMQDCARNGHMNNGQDIKTHCKRGHPFDATNTYHRPDGGRACISCQREAVRLWRSKRKQLDAKA